MSIIIVKKIEPVKDGGNLRAFADVLLPQGILLRSCRIVQESGKRAWVSMPQIAWIDSSGIKNYRTLVTLPNNLKNEVSEAILAKWETNRDE